MHVSTRILATLTAALFTIGATVLSGAQMAPGSVRGAVVDASGGVLPGVTVVASDANGHVLETVVTDAVGRYALAALPAGSVHLTFELAGFSTAAAEVAIQPGVEARVGQRLELATRTENVEVRAHAPAVPTVARPVKPPPPPPPAPDLQPVAPHDHDSVCGPAKRNHGIDALGTVRAVRRGAAHDMYGQGDELMVEGGTLDGLVVGQNFSVRRYFALHGFLSAAAGGEHTAGVLQIVAADEHTSTGVVIYACDEMRPGDFLAAFTPEPRRTPAPPGAPDFDSAARILFADADALLGAPGRSMVIDRGHDYGLLAGQRLTLFRRDSKRTGPRVVGEAIIVAVRVDSATIRIVRVTDAVSPGDWAAPQRSSIAVPTVAASHAGRP